MTPALTRLRELAEKAHANDEIWWDDPKEWMRASQIMWIDELDAAYLAAIAPSTVLALIRAIEVLREACVFAARNDMSKLSFDWRDNGNRAREALAQADLEIEAIK